MGASEGADRHDDAGDSTGKAVFVYPGAGFGGTLTFDGAWIGDDPHQAALAAR